MRKAFTLMLAALSLASCVSQSGKNPQNFKNAPLLGMVYDADNQPCVGVRIVLDEKLEVTSDIRGRFVLPDLARGDHRLTATADGYEDLAVDFSFVTRTDALYLRMVTATQLVAMAEEALEVRQWAEARGFLDRAVELSGQDPVATYLRGLLAFREGEHERCVAILEALLNSGVREPHVYLLLADVYEKHLDMPQKAIINLEAYLELRPDPEAKARVDALKSSAETNY